MVVVILSTLGPWLGFQSRCFHFCAFSNIQVMQFSLHKLKNSFSHAFLVTNDFSVADLVHVDFWCEQGIITRCV